MGTASTTPSNRIELWDLGRANYLDTWALQQVIHGDRVKAALQRQRGEEYERLPDVVLQVEHTPVYTLGRGATPLGFKFDLDGTRADAVSKGQTIDDGGAAPGAPPDLFHVFRCDRGGQITWHGPGQAVAYPIIDLAAEGSPFQRDLRTYVHNLEDSVIQAVGGYGVHAERLDGYPGVWVDRGRRKIGAIGASASRWVTMHGLALNISCNLAVFDRIVPCGILGRQVTSLAEQLEGSAPCPTMSEAQAALVAALSRSLHSDISASAESPQGIREAIARVGSDRVLMAKQAILQQGVRGGRFDVLQRGTSRSGDLTEAG